MCDVYYQLYLNRYFGCIWLFSQIFKVVAGGLEITLFETPAAFAVLRLSSWAQNTAVNAALVGCLETDQSTLASLYWR